MLTSLEELIHTIHTLHTIYTIYTLHTIHTIHTTGVRLVLHVGNRRFYFSRGGMVLILERCQARITCGESQILHLSRSD